MAKRFPVLVDDATPEAPPVLTPGTVVPDGLNPGYHKIVVGGGGPPAAHAASHALPAGSDPVTLLKSQVGLGNVDNTSDATKSVLYAATAGGAPPTGLAGGDLDPASSFPNPTLKVIGAATGPLGSATRTPTVTIDTKGRVTALTDQAIQIAESQVTGLVADLAGKQPRHGFPVSATGAYSVVLTYSAGNKKVTLTPTGASFDFWIGGTKFTKVGPQTSPAHSTAASGPKFFYYDSAGVLQTADTAWSIIDETVIPVAYCYWNATLADGQGFFELHTDQRDLAWHKSHHETEGTLVKSGFDVSGYTLNVDSDVAVTFAVAAGVVVDEDIFRTTDPIPDAGTYWHWYMTGTTQEWRWNSSNFPFLYGTYPQRNYDAGGATGWTTADVLGTSNGQWVCYYGWASLGLAVQAKMMFIPGQVAHTSLANAQAESYKSLNLGTLPFQELAPVWKFIYHAKSGYGGNYKCRLEGVERLNATGASVFYPSTPGTSITAGSVSNTPTAPITAINVQSALDQLAAWVEQNVLSQCGDGSDGAIVFDGVGAVAGCTLAGSTYTLTRVLLATSVRHDNGVIISEDGFYVLCRGERLWNGEIRILAKDGATPAGSAASWSARPLYAGQAGGVGKSGGAGGGTGTSAITTTLGGRGGKGGNVGANAGGTGGTASWAAANTAANSAPLGFDLLYNTMASGAVLPMRGGTGGGGGAADATGVGGGGGGGGGLGLSRSHTMTIGASATLRALGGNGGAAGAANGGGGAGGGGGHYRICAHVLTGTVPLAATACAGGTGGAGSGTGLVGADGSVGTVDVIYF